MSRYYFYKGDYMTVKENQLKQARLPESAQIFDNSSQEFEAAYRLDFKRVKTVVLLNNTEFNDVITAVTGPTFNCEPYRTGLLLINLAVASAPTDIVFDIQFSDDNAHFFSYVIGPFGDLRYEDSAGAKKECMEFPILAPYMRVVVTATGTTSSATFTATVKAILNGI
jgi:hypothetical protein